MTDEKYAFFEDVRNRAITARSAHSRPKHGASRSKKYTEKEMQKMNGQDHTVKLGKRMTFAELKTLPESLQKEYIRDILNRYDVSATAIAEVLDVHPRICQLHLKALGFMFRPGGGRKKAEVERLRADFGICGAQAPTPAKKIALQNLAFSFCGNFDAAGFAELLNAAIPVGQAVRVNVAVEVVQSGALAT